jgi:DnaK suppressor protein
VRPKDDWDLADERGEVPTRPTAAGGQSPWQVIERLDEERAVAIRRRLEERLAQLDRELGEVERQIAPGDEGPRPQYGKRVGDHTSEALETRRNVAAAEALRVQRAEAERALAKLGEESYGLCDGCGGPIGEERLEALPWAGECVHCRGKRDGRARSSS